MPFKYTPEQQTIAFWNRIAITADDNLCWEWKAARSKTGYGNTYFRGDYQRAHRIAWMYPDYVIPDGLEVCHSCDNPICCNPKHLFIGTHKENMQDRDFKKRCPPPPHYKGELNPRSKLTKVEASAIRAEYLAGKTTYKELSDRYKVGLSQIARIVRNEHWKE